MLGIMLSGTLSALDKAVPGAVTALGKGQLPALLGSGPEGHDQCHSHLSTTSVMLLLTMKDPSNSNYTNPSLAPAPGHRDPGSDSPALSCFPSPCTGFQLTMLQLITRGEEQGKAMLPEPCPIASEAQSCCFLRWGLPPAAGQGMRAG